MSFCAGAVLKCNTKDTATLLGDDKFLALEEEVVIIPKFSSEQLFDGFARFGPFRAHSSTKVPLWAALEMDRLQQCTIEPPQWLHEEELKRMRAEEKENKDSFGRVPKHYIEIAFAFLTQSKAFSSDPRAKERTVVLLRELIELRRKKILNGLKEFEVRPGEMVVTDMSAAELTCFRTRSVNALNKFLELMQSQRVVQNQPDQRDPEVPATGEDDSNRQLEDSSGRP